MDIAEYARQHNASVIEAQSLSGMGWHRNDDGWLYFQRRITVKLDNRQMTLDWKQGEAHGTNLPEPETVLSALISEGMAFEGAQGLDDFMAEFGYESRKEAKKIWRALELQYPRIVNLFGGKETWDYVTETVAW